MFRGGSLFTEEDVVPIGLPHLIVRIVPITIAYPCIEHNQPCDVLWIVNSIEILLCAVPYSPCFRTCAEGRAGLRISAFWKRDFVYSGIDRKEGNIERLQAN